MYGDREKALLFGLKNKKIKTMGRSLQRIDVIYTFLGILFPGLTRFFPITSVFYFILVSQLYRVAQQNADKVS